MTPSAGYCHCVVVCKPIVATRAKLRTLHQYLLSVADFDECRCARSNQPRVSGQVSSNWAVRESKQEVLGCNLTCKLSSDRISNLYHQKLICEWHVNTDSSTTIIARYSRTYGVRRTRAPLKNDTWNLEFDWGRERKWGWVWFTSSHGSANVIGDICKKKHFLWYNSIRPLAYLPIRSRQKYSLSERVTRSNWL